MAVVKKNPIFCLVVGLCVIVFAGGCYMAFAQSGKVSKAEAGVRMAKQQLNSLVGSSPAPSDFNVTSSEGNVKALREDLEAIRDGLQRGSRIEVSDDGVGVMAAIQQYISEYQNKAANHTIPDPQESDEMIADPIKTPENFAFGFERYIGVSTIPGNKATIPLLDKQRQILEYLMNKLIEADPQSIKSVARELVEVDASADAKKAADASKTGFQISPEVSARVPGAVDTMAFKISFTGYTQSLRLFLNALSNFDMPIVVRSIEVERAAPEAKNTRSQQRNNLDDIFSVFGGGQSAPAEQKTEEAEQSKPVVTENISSFTVIVEFIDIILPSEAEEEPS